MTVVVDCYVKEVLSNMRSKEKENEMHQWQFGYLTPTEGVILETNLLEVGCGFIQSKFTILFVVFSVKCVIVSLTLFWGMC